MRTELRQCPRVQLPSYVALAFSHLETTASVGGGRTGRGMVTNLSMKGCQVNSEASVEIGDHVCLQFHMPHPGPSPSIELATVRWAKGSQFGLEFISLWPADENLLHDFIETVSQEGQSS